MPNEDACGGVPKPTNQPSPNGYWKCSGKTWVWIYEIGRIGNFAIYKTITYDEAVKKFNL